MVCCTIVVPGYNKSVVTLAGLTITADVIGSPNHSFKIIFGNYSFKQAMKIPMARRQWPERRSLIDTLNRTGTPMTISHC
jgi:hypothetical protein